MNILKRALQGFISNKKEHGIKVATVLSLHKLKAKITREAPIPLKLDITIDQVIDNRFPGLQPIKALSVRNKQIRFNLVTDSLEKDSLWGGTATAIILSTLFCIKYNIPLRIITRTAPPNPTAYINFLALLGYNSPENVEFFSDYDRNSKPNNTGLEISDHDVFLSTSWWTSTAVNKINLRNKFFYLVQEVEPFFYPYSDDHLLCSQLLDSKNIKFIINSELLFNYFRGYNKNVTDNGVFFEPSFPKHLFAPIETSFKPKEKYKFFFYARPNNPRNLFYHGLSIVENAIKRNLINDKEWDLYFVGANFPEITFSGGIKPKIIGQLNWQEYMDMIPTIDLALSMIYTPHPSYPPIDIAASGGVVLTNKFLNKTSLEGYSRNIITSDLDMNNMLKGFEEASILAKDLKKRKENFDQNNISKDWNKSLNHVLEYIKNEIDGK